MAAILPGARTPEPGFPGPTLEGPEIRLHRRCAVLRLIGFLLVVWVVVTVVGAVLEGLFWLAVVGVLLFVVTAVIGWNKRDTRV
jgi:hypothetical protein